MNRMRRLLRSSERVISLMLVLGLLSFSLFPHHFHLHHADASVDAGAVAHVIHAHQHIGVEDAGSNDSHTLEASSDITIKSPGPLIPILALVFLVALLLPRQRLTRYRLSRVGTYPCPSFVPHNTPPLRAPPRP